MEIVICPDADRAETLTAAIVAARVAENPECVLGLPTGRTMIGVYARLAAGEVSLRRVTTFNLDEYVGLGAGDPQSFAAYMARHFVEPTGIDPARVHLPDGRASDLAAEAARYEAAIAAAGGIDLQLLGIGRTGHIGFNEPMSSLNSRTRDKLLTPETREQNAGDFGGNADAVPARALTMGVGTILEAKEVVLLAVGEAKADVIRRTLEGPVTAQVTATALQFHNACTIVLDEAAASRLDMRDYYDFVSRNEPKWDRFREFLSGS